MQEVTPLPSGAVRMAPALRGLPGSRRLAPRRLAGPTMSNRFESPLHPRPIQAAGAPHRRSLHLPILALLVFLAAGTASAQEAGPRMAGAPAEDCLDCHTKRERLLKALSDPARDVTALVLDADLLKGSVHGGQDCSDCHLDYDAFPHSDDRMTAGCVDCHADAAEAYDASVHGQVSGEAGKQGAACADCHGVHDIYRETDRRSRLHPLNVYRVCGQCHFGVDPATATVEELLREPYTDDAHARGILRDGLAVSATCVSCHGGHAIRARGDPESEVARTKIDQICGQCHITVAEDYRTSVHHVRANGNGHKGATCSDCHPPHEIRQADTDFRMHSVETCARCHTERAGTFRRTYHGKLSSLGFGQRVATCEQCHGAHLIQPREDPRSLISSENLVRTCGACHEGSHEGFVEYRVHGDPRAGGSGSDEAVHLVYLAMISLIAVVVVLGMAHVLMWLARSLIGTEWRLSSERERSGRFIRRWPPFYVGIEILATTTILILAGTGLPLFFADQEWARGIMHFMGGAGTAAFLHRAAAVVLMATFVVFLGNIAGRWLIRREKGLFAGPDTMLPRWKDMQDFLGNLRWFVGRGPKPRFDRWTYWEKFDFWAVFWGMGIMGVSGLMLWFPVETTRFVPAWVVLAAGVIHGLEALLAVAFHFAVQAFQSHLRPDRFPLDLSFFTGVTSIEELEEEHPLEYERLLASGRLDGLQTGPVAPVLRRLAFGFGIGAVTVGLVLLLIIVFAFVRNAL